MALKIRIEPTFDMERDAKRRLQRILKSQAHYGLPPIPCADQAALRIPCHGCGKVIWATPTDSRCDECKDKGIGFGFDF